ncbi:MAG: four helix bundle protein [bacterium]|nr:four helix bundle protein [bacterium]
MTGNKEFVKDYEDLRVFQGAMDTAMQIFKITKSFPVEERYSLVDQIRRSSRSVCANIAEAWRKRRYKRAFVSKLSDAEAEAGETQVWLKFAEKCGYLGEETLTELDTAYRVIIAQIISMIDNAGKWTFKDKG